MIHEGYFDRFILQQAINLFAHHVFDKMSKWVFVRQYQTKQGHDWGLDLNIVIYFATVTRMNFVLKLFKLQNL